MDDNPNKCYTVTEFEREVIDRLARIETKLEGVDTLEKRVQSLEASANQHKGVQLFLMSAVALVSGLLGAFGGKLI